MEIMGKTSTKKTSKASNSKKIGRIKNEKKKKVTFKFRAPEAKSVSVAGNVSGWDVFSNPLSQSQKGMGDGMWEKVICLEPGMYEYRFFVDGVWCDDPLCEEYCRNEFGTNNSLIRV